MKLFSDVFNSKLYTTIADIEQNSLIEVVAIIKPQSAKYRDISFFGGVVFLFIVYTYFMFSPTVFDVYLIYFLTIISFVIGFAIVEIIQPLKKLFIPKKRLNKAVEIYGRAIFQKGGLRHTKEKIGVLIYVSLFEKKVYMIADRGIEIAIPLEEWNKIEANFQNIFTSENIAESFIEQLNKCKSIFSEYMPAGQKDINELSDNMNIEL